MPVDPPPSLLMTPDLRRRLQQRYDEASRLAALPRPDFARIHDLLAECLRADPDNILYLDALLANLRRREAQRAKSWWRKWLPRSRLLVRPAKNAAQSTQYSVLSTAPEQLWQNPLDASLLARFAEAAAALEFDEAELRYLFAARDLAPDDPTTIRMLARSLTRQGRFEDAVGPWFAVLALAPDDEARQAVEDLRGAQESVEAENALADAHAAAGGDLTILGKREELRLARSALRMELARRRAAHDPHPKAQSLVARLEAEHNRLEIDIYNLRAERWPEDVPVRIELGRRLKRAGNFSGAIQRLEEALKLSADEPAVLIELGENWQHLRQFAKALDIYRRAIDVTAKGDTSLLNLARYRAAVLATALGQIDEAKSCLAAIVAVDPTFKDARERLDKLGSN
jgi:Flp pilus assembly protein TadD